jgi:hypothetical protein
MVPPLFAETSVSEQVLEPIPEIHTTDLPSIPKPVTEDVLLVTPIFSNAESTVDQTKMISVLKLMLDAQEHHIRDHHSIESAQNSLLAETLTADTYGERPQMVLGDHSPHTTSGITTTVPKLCAET